MAGQDTKFKVNDAYEQLPPRLKQYLKAPSDQQIPYVKYGFWEKMARFFTMLTPIGWLQSLFRNYVVEEGQVGLIWENSKPKLLPPGRHVLLSPTTFFVNIRNITDPVIQHGPMQLVNVKEGQLAYLLDSETGKIELLTAGQHFIYSPTKKFQNFIDLNEATNKLGTLDLIRIETGQVGIVYDAQGALNIIEPGIHLIAPPIRFKGIASTQQEILELPVTSFKGGDNVPLNIKADVFYTIKTPKTTFTIIKDVIKFIKDLAIATLGGIIQNSTIADIGQSSKPTYSKKTESDNKVEESKIESAPLNKTFSSKVHDDFLEQLHDHTLEEYGVDISNIRIEALNIADQNLANQLSQQAITRAQADAALANIDAQNEVRIRTAENEAKQAEVIAQGKAKACNIQATAESNAIIVKAEAAARACELQGKAEAIAQQASNEVRLQYVDAVGKMQSGKELLLLEAQGRALGSNAKIVVPNNAQILNGLGLFSVTDSVADTFTNKQAAETKMSFGSN
jgi:regulator of protease activity HflC (stomatin/prohibitin superfamily)